MTVLYRGIALGQKTADADLAAIRQTGQRKFVVEEYDGKPGSGKVAVVGASAGAKKDPRRNRPFAAEAAHLRLRRLRGRGALRAAR